jgi:hypothetical protein
VLLDQLRGITKCETVETHHKVGASTALRAALPTEPCAIAVAVEELEPIPSATHRTGRVFASEMLGVDADLEQDIAPLSAGSLAEWDVISECHATLRDFAKVIWRERT